MDVKHSLYRNKLIKNNNIVITSKSCIDDENVITSNSNTMGGFTVTPTAPQMTDVTTNRCGEAKRRTVDVKLAIPILALMLFLFSNLALSEIVIGDQYVYTYAKIYFQVSAPPAPPIEPVRFFVSFGISFVAISFLFRFFDIEFSTSGFLKMLGLALAIAILISILTLI